MDAETFDSTRTHVDEQRSYIEGGSTGKEDGTAGKSLCAVRQASRSSSSRAFSDPATRLIASVVELDLNVGHLPLPGTSHQMLEHPSQENGMLMQGPCNVD